MIPAYPTFLQTITLLVGLFTFGSTQAAARFQHAPSPISSSDFDALHETLVQSIQSSRLQGATLGMKVIAIPSGEVIFDWHGDRRMIPASNVKLFTGALVLDRLGANYRIRTPFGLSVEPDAGGIVRGDLVVMGRGDPGAVPEAAESAEELLDLIVKRLMQAGVQKIEGNLVARTGYFRGPLPGAGWSWDDLQYAYAAVPATLNYAQNCVKLDFIPKGEGLPVGWKVKPPTRLLEFHVHAMARDVESTDIHWRRDIGGSDVFVSGDVAMAEGGTSIRIAVPAPELFFLEQLRAALNRAGVMIQGDDRMEELKEAPPVILGEGESVAMAGLVSKMMKDSNNLLAQLLLLQVGASYDRTNAPQARTTEEVGLCALQEFLEGAGIPSSEVLLDEGTGLSRANLITPNAVVQLLAFMQSHPSFDTFHDSLAVAGVDGTLRHRLTPMTDEPRIRAKTGTLRNVHALSGYMRGPNESLWAFSILLNGYVEAEKEVNGGEVLDFLATELAIGQNVREGHRQQEQKEQKK